MNLVGFGHSLGPYYLVRLWGVLVLLSFVMLFLKLFCKNQLLGLMLALKCIFWLY